MRGDGMVANPLLISPIFQYIQHFEGSAIPSGAGSGIRVGLQNLFNDDSEESKLLALQLDLLKQHSKSVIMM
jgi:hypothetical protein